MAQADLCNKNIEGTHLEIDYLKSQLIEVCKCEAELKSWKAEQIGQGLGYLSVIVKVTLEWENCKEKECKLPTEVVVKTPFQENFRNLMAKLSSEDVIADLIGKEDDLENDPLKNGFLNEIIILNYLKEVSSLLKVPKLYLYKNYVNREDIGYVVMESFAKTGMVTNMCDGLTLQQTQQGIMTLAAVQAHAIKDPSWRGTIKGFPPELMDKWGDTLAGTKAALIEMNPDEFGPLVSKLEWLWNIETFKKFNHQEDSKNETSKRAMLVHGDIHANNMLFKKNEDGTASDELVALIDWQLGHAGYVMEDICRLLIMLDTEDRHNHSNDLIKLYYDTLIQHLHGHTCPMDLPWLYKAHKAFTSFQCFMMMMFCPMMKQMDGFAGTKERVDKMTDRTHKIMIDTVKLNEEENLIEIFSSL